MSKKNNSENIQMKNNYIKNVIDDIYSAKRHYQRDPALLKNLSIGEQTQLFTVMAHKVTDMFDFAEGGDVKEYMRKDLVRFSRELYEYAGTEKDENFFIGAETHGLLLQQREREAIKPIIDLGYNADIVTDVFTFQYENMHRATQIYRRKYLNLH